MGRRLMLAMAFLLMIVFPIVASANASDRDDLNKQNVLQEYDEAHLIALAAATCLSRSCFSNPDT